MAPISSDEDEITTFERRHAAWVAETHRQLGLLADKIFPQPARKPGGAPCGECHLDAGEECDICGAVEPINA